MYNKHSSSKILLNLIVLALIAARIYVECRPLSSDAAKVPRSSLLDPLLAMPTEHQQQQVVYQNQYEQPSADSVGYMVPYEQQESSVQQQQQTDQANQQKQEVYYVIDSEGRQQASSVDTEPEQPCDRKYHTQVLEPNHQTETATQVASRGDYPAEILYLGGSGAQQTDENSKGNLLMMSPKSEARASDYVEAVGQSAGLPATILSEVPIRDIPPHVLEKLKKHYGVRVVATRERPGANLVINCDDYSGHSGPICATRSTQTPGVELEQNPADHQQYPGETDQINGNIYRSSNDSGSEQAEQDQGLVHYVEQPTGEFQTMGDAEPGNQDASGQTAANVSYMQTE